MARSCSLGKVGTGVTGQERARLGAVLAGLAIDEPPSIRRRREVSWTARWVRPVVVADVPFAEWTSSGTLRHPSHVATRGDKEPRDVVRESRRLGPSGR